MARTGGRTAPCRRLHPHQGIGRTAEPHPKPHRNDRHSDTAPGGAPTRHPDKKPSEAMPTCRLRTASFVPTLSALPISPKTGTGTQREKKRDKRCKNEWCAAHQKRKPLTKFRHSQTTKRGRAGMTTAVPKVRLRRAGRVGVLCGEYSSTCRRVLECLAESTFANCARRLSAFRKRQTGNETIVPANCGQGGTVRTAPSQPVARRASGKKRFTKS